MSFARRVATVAGAALVTSLVAVAPAVAAPEAMAPLPASSPAAHGHKVVHPTLGHGKGAPGVSRNAGAASGSGQLTYHGGNSGVGVTTGAPRVYLVFWGSQWGTSGTDANGDVTLTGDRSAMAPRLQELFKGLGTNSELWSGVMSQFCEGVTSGSSTCPASALHVGYPTGGGVLAGVWYDNASASPTNATATQIAQEANSGVTHFAPSSATLRNAQIVVVSPTGTHPDTFNTPAGNFCAWHDWNGSYGVTNAIGNFAFTNLPYITDMGASCGANYVNAGAAGALDGVTMVEGHEYAETVTDQFPSGGWWDAAGYENGDKCSWNGDGGTGGSQNVTFATGTFAMQATYSNDGSACLIAHSVVVNATNTVTVTSPGAQSSALGTAIAPITVTATDSDVTKTPFTWSASNLPTGLSINATTGAISGTPTAAGTTSVVVTAKDTVGVTGSATFSWAVVGNTITVTKPANQTGTKGVAVTGHTPSASDSNGSITTFTWSATGLPAGLTINSASGAISGTPTGTGTSTVTLKATDSTGASGTTSFSWVISSTTVTVTSPGTQTTARSTTIPTLTLVAKDSNPALTTFTWSSSGLPSGLRINSTTGAITGKTSTSARTYTVRITARDANGASGSVSFSWVVN